eukprot:m.123230 g.123230  ORF g.123230 m.123230 type:complete len:120 (+) comp17278_c2_seq17:6236-6595(+)
MLHCGYSRNIHAKHRVRVRRFVRYNHVRDRVPHVAWWLPLVYSEPLLVPVVLQMLAHAPSPTPSLLNSTSNRGDAPIGAHVQEWQYVHMCGVVCTRPVLQKAFTSNNSSLGHGLFRFIM